MRYMKYIDAAAFYVNARQITRHYFQGTNDRLKIDEPSKRALHTTFFLLSFYRIIKLNRAIFQFISKMYSSEPMIREY